MKNNRNPLNIILLGDPAAGKATHAKFLAQKFNLYDLDMGRELRRIHDPLLRNKFKLSDTLDKGNLTPTALVRKILFYHIHNTPKTQGLLFDGTPKMIGESKLVCKWLKAEKRNNPIVIYLSVPVSETLRRMRERKADFAGKFGKRADDNPKALKRRISYYRKNIREVTKFFNKVYTYKKLSSNAPVLKVRKILVKILRDYEKKLHQNAARN